MLLVLVYAPVVGTRKRNEPQTRTSTERDAAGGHCSTEPTPQRCRTIACRRKDHDPPALAAPARRPACAPPQGPDERMRVRSTGAAAALGVAPRGAPRCCRPHQSVRSTLEPSPCRRAPLPTRTRSSAVACSGSSGCGGESQFEVSEWLVARVGICCTAAAGQR